MYVFSFVFVRFAYGDGLCCGVYFIQSLHQDSFIHYPIGSYWRVFSSVFYYSKSCCYDSFYTCLLVHMSKSFSKI